MAHWEVRESLQASRAEAPSDRWSAYTRWNSALADLIYGPDSAGLPAYLDLEEELLGHAAALAES